MHASFEEADVCVRTVQSCADPRVLQGDLNPWITNAVSDSSLRGPRIALPSCSVRETVESEGSACACFLCCANECCRFGMLRNVYSLFGRVFGG